MLIITAAALFVDLRRGWTEEAVTRVVIDLGDSPRGGSLTDALARAVGDPSLVLGYVLDDGAVVDEAGGRVELPSGETDRAVTSIEAGDGVAAVLVHDRATLRAPGLADSVAAAVRLALDNVELESQIRARVRDVEASRARLLAARDSELRRLETRLRAGVEPRLERAAQALAGLERDPEPFVQGAARTICAAPARSSARFAAGLHPVGLDTGGLPPALDALAATAPVRVELTVACGRLAEDVELAAWFVCSEALANVVKHAAAGRVTIAAELSGGRLLVTVADDGRGGADPAAGRGLRGLAARVEAAGGSLEVGERPGGGTLLRAWLPARERDVTRARLEPIAIAAAAVGLGLAAADAARRAPGFSLAGDSPARVALGVVAGWTVVAAGLALRGGGSRAVGRLLAAGGCAWLAAGLATPGAAPRAAVHARPGRGDAGTGARSAGRCCWRPETGCDGRIASSWPRCGWRSAGCSACCRRSPTTRPPPAVPNARRTCSGSPTHRRPSRRPRARASGSVSSRSARASRSRCGGSLAPRRRAAGARGRSCCPDSPTSRSSRRSSRTTGGVATSATTRPSRRSGPRRRWR